MHQPSPDFLFRAIRDLPSVGPKLETLFDKVLLRSGDVPPALVRDLLLKAPTGIINRPHIENMAEVEHGTIGTLRVQIDYHEGRRGRSKSSPYRVIASDDSGTMTLTFFHAHVDYLIKMLPEGRIRYISGKFERYGEQIQMVHPDYIVGQDKLDEIPLEETVYAYCQGLFPKTYRKVLLAALETSLPDLPEWLDSEHVKRLQFPRFSEAVRAVHRTPSDASPELGLKRLSYDELFAHQLSLSLVREHYRRSAGEARKTKGVMLEKLKGALPFALTRSQESAIDDIVQDLGKPQRMLRLLQGDVGAGKTVVALAAMAYASETGAQSALMAPTEVLARQHFETIAPLAEALGLHCELLTGSTKTKARKVLLEGLSDSSIDIVIGTHSLFQESVIFANLGLAVIDEQHRFGVEQRLKLASKGAATDSLFMTATPIPRSLIMSWYGDMDVSRLTEKPAGRKPIETAAVSLNRLSDVAARLEKALAAGDKAYWICPLVEESEHFDLAAAEERYNVLHRRFGNKVALLHGRTPADEKDGIFQRFREGDVQLLVATTVVEVGVDVRDASIMIIEHAERFGLSQLHQLRGRVGRGEKASVCLLLYKAPLGQTARARLEIMKETEDGFRIAEEDLRLRGAGDLLGVKQSGMPQFRIADAERDAKLTELAQKEARHLVSQDPHLQSERGKHVRFLLRLFGRDASIKLLSAG
jgi:ATP-dependent DNA helicase RecG